MKYCPNCGAVNGDRMEKCNSCGSAFPPAADMPTQEPQTAPSNDSLSNAADSEVPVNDTISNAADSEVPVLELGTDEYVQPPVFPEDMEESKIELTLGNEEPEKIIPPIYPEPPIPDPVQSTAPQDAPGTTDTDLGGTTDTEGHSTTYSQPAGAAGSSGETPPSGSGTGFSQPHDTTGNHSSGDRINLTQQAINEQKQRQQSGAHYSSQTSTSYGASIDGTVTGTLGLVFGIIGLVLVVVFGGIGSCSGVAAFSLIMTLIGLALSIAGLVISSRDKQLSGGTCTRANAAFTVSLIGVIIGALLLIIGISCVGCIGCMACSAVSTLVP